MHASLTRSCAARRICPRAHSAVANLSVLPRCQQRRPSPRAALVVRAAAASGAAAPVATPPPAITLTDNALEHLKKLQADNKDANVLLRVGVRQGGCSGMSYQMDFETEGNIAGDDYIINYEGGFRLVCDPKSLLYLFGMSLDYSTALIGGGFQFHNPNAADTCGCGKSFGV